MKYREMVEELRSTAAHMDIAAEAGEEGDWGRVERGLREVHTRSAALLQEIGIKRLSDVVPGERVRQAG
jgi:hypothetical protein